MIQTVPSRILLDIETQRDFFLPGGSCYKRGARGVARRIYQLFRWARGERIPVISTVLRVRPNERGPLARVPHCIDGSRGEQKLPRTVLPRRINLGLRNTTDLPADLLNYQQIIFEKRYADLFLHARAERLITELPMTTFVICGAGVAGGIAQTAIGLRFRGFDVILATDAVLDLAHPLAEMAYRRMAAKGVVFAETWQIVSPQLRQRTKPMRKTAPGGAVQATPNPS
ncbi:MAG TPA: isochorismatase family protein [Phycisphaerae bacterium]|nr:isochorismatase family protein [Phycisphaerae bacterium]